MQGCKALFDKKIIHRDLNIKNVLIHYKELELDEADLQKMEDRFFR